MNNDTTTEAVIEEVAVTDTPTDIDEVISEVEDIEEATDPAQCITEELETLRAQVCELTAQLERKQAEAERISAQLGDFNELFPEASVQSLPDEVWEDVKNGNSLAASYAIYQRKVHMAEMRIKEINQKNASLSAGKAGTNTASEFFSPDEVRSMTREQVRCNYQKIINSMKKWN